MSDLYNMKSAGYPGAFIFTKFNENLEVISSYLTSADDCACPQGQKHIRGKLCRHQKMIPMFRGNKHIGDGWLLDFETRTFRPPPKIEDVEEESEIIETDRIIDDQGIIEKAPDDEKPSEGILPPKVEATAVTPQAQPVKSSGAPKLIRRIIR